MVVLVNSSGAMLFSDRPKSSLSDLYNMEAEVNMLIRSLSLGRAMTLILGLRRLGKTSLLRAVLNHVEKPYMLFDLRVYDGLRYIPGIRLGELIADNLSILVSKYEGLKKLLERVKEIKILGFEVSIDPRRSKSVLPKMLEALNSWASSRGEKIILAFDEAQLLNGFRIDFPAIFAYAYDYLDSLQFILTGSEVGLLYDFLKINDPNSPLYGRYMEEIRLKRLERAIEFLRLGFREAGLKPLDEDLENAVDALDGVIGWLSYYGLTSIRIGDTGRKALEATLEIGSKIVYEEVSKLLNRLNSSKYMVILKALAVSPLRWSEIKNILVAKYGVAYDKNLSNLLSKLIKTGIVVKEDELYRIADPVYQYALRKPK